MACVLPTTELARTFPILVDINRLHILPRFRRDQHGVYAQLVYAGHSSDVSDVMVNGRWLMRHGSLLTIDETGLIEATQDYARRIDAFLIKREQSVLAKLIAIGGAAEAESFEVQIKVRLEDSTPILKAVESDEIEDLHHRHFHEFDNYFLFNDPDQGRLRYREDEYIDQDGQIENVRYRLTHLGEKHEETYHGSVLLSRSRYLAPASHSLRFYREYFKPSREMTIEKERYRWRVLFHGTEFFINIDNLLSPNMGYFLEVKSRTWSRKDAEHKAQLAIDLINFLGADASKAVHDDYSEFLFNS